MCKVVCMSPCTADNMIYSCMYLMIENITFSDGHDICFLCEAPVDVKFEPCGHALMCHNCADRAKKCPTCKVFKFHFTV